MNRCENHIDHYRLDGEKFDYFENADLTHRAYEILFRKFIAKLANRGGSVLDIGSGSGWTSSVRHERLYHVDLSPANLARLKSDGAFPVGADAGRLPFKSDSMDVAIASEILEHLNDPKSAAAEILRVVKPGGIAIVSTPYKERLRYTLCIHCNQLTPLNAHLHSFDRKSLTRLFDGKVLKVYVFGSKIFTLFRLTRLFARLPLWLWRMINYPFLKILDKAHHIVIVLEK